MIMILMMISYSGDIDASKSNQNYDDNENNSSLTGYKQCRRLWSLNSSSWSHNTEVHCIFRYLLNIEVRYRKWVLIRNVLGTKCLADILSEREKIANWMEVSFIMMKMMIVMILMLKMTG